MKGPEDRRNRLLLALAGYNLILLNYTLIRQMTLAFRDLETSALLMALAYFAGISLGYLTSERITLGALHALLPVFLIAQMAMISVAPVLVLSLTQTAGATVAYVVVFVLVTVGSSSLYSIFLPKAIGSGGDASGTRRYYAVEILGSLLGLASLPVLSRAGMILFYVVYLASFLGIAALSRLRPVALVALSVLSAGFLVSFDRIDRSVSLAYYRRFYDEADLKCVVHTRYSPYHKIEVLENADGGRFLILNAHRQFGPGGHFRYSYFVAEYPARLLKRPAVCLLGCGSMSTVGRMGDFVTSIMIVDLDQAVFETSRAYFAKYNRLWELNNWSFRSDDAKHFLATTPRRFDLVIDDIPPAKTRQIALTYTKEFFGLVRSRLAPGGIFSLPSLTPLHSEREYGRRILATLAEVFDQVVVLSHGGNSYYFATDRGTVFDREALRRAIDHPDRDEVEIRLPAEVRDLVRGVQTISINNMADLILY